MTPKEKSEELFTNYKYSITYYGQLVNEWNEDAKKCALIAVDEIIGYAKTFGDVTDQDVQYFESVKEELLKM